MADNNNTNTTNTNELDNKALSDEQLKAVAGGIVDEPGVILDGTQFAPKTNVYHVIGGAYLYEAIGNVPYNSIDDVVQMRKIEWNIQWGPQYYSGMFYEDVTVRFLFEECELWN